MAKPFLLIGGCHNYGWHQLKNWVKTAQRHSNCDIAVLASDIDGASVQKLVQEGCQVAVHQHHQNLAPHVERFMYIYDYLSKTSYDYVLMTDVKDVVFQRNPFEELQICGANLICGSEGLRYQHEPWGDQNLQQTFGAHLWNQWRTWEIFNVGVIAGTQEDVKYAALQIFLTSINRAIPICDQAVWNYLTHATGLAYSVHFSSPEEGWCAHLGTLADPTKMEQFRPHLLYKEPIFQDGLVCNYQGLPYAIVHQYDRVVEWKSKMGVLNGLDN
jgi:hypothetical protein